MFYVEKKYKTNITFKGIYSKQKFENTNSTTMLYTSY